MQAGNRLRGIPKEIGKEKDEDAENVQENVQETNRNKLSERQCVILDMIRKGSTISLEEMSKKTNVTLKTIQRDLKAMNHIVKRVGPDKGGHWEIIK